MTRNDEPARRAYWIRYMEEMDDLVQQVLDYPCEENGESLVPIDSAMREAGVEVEYSDTKLDGDLPRVYAIRSGLVDSLVAIARKMNERGWIMRIEDGFRTQEMQTRLVCSRRTFDQVVAMCVWECEGKVPSIDLVYRRGRVLVANHGKTGTHMHGAAVDVSVFRASNGTEVDRGKPYLEMSEVTPMDSPFVTPEHRQNRRDITAVMESEGFLHFPGEFWHFNQGDVLYQVLAGTGQPGIYGPVHWDRTDGTLTPYDDPMAPLVPNDRLQHELEMALQRVAS